MVGRDTPFFLAAGFIRPHLPFMVPDKYFEYHPLEDICLPSNPYAPNGMPQIAWSNFGELRNKQNDIDENMNGHNNSTERDWLAAVT